MIALVVVIVVAGVLLAVFLLRRRRKRRRESEDSSSDHVYTKTDLQIELSSPKPDAAVNKQDSSASFLQDIVIKEQIGKGNFATVYRGYWGTTEVI